MHLHDLGSQNGTRLNEVPSCAPTPLHSGDLRVLPSADVKLSVRVTRRVYERLSHTGSVYIKDFSMQTCDPSTEPGSWARFGTEIPLSSFVAFTRTTL